MVTGAFYPNDGGYFGINSSSDLVYVTLQAPRVRAVVGSYANVVHELRLQYLHLADDTPERPYLLIMEPYLFPDGDYGELQDLPGKAHAT